MDPLLAAEIQLGGQALEIGLQHRVDHARHGIRAIDGRRAVQQHFHPAHARRRNGVGVDRHNRHEVLGLRAGMVHHPPAVQQHQRIARSKRAQVDRRGVASGVVHAADRPRRIE